MIKTTKNPAESIEQLIRDKKAFVIYKKPKAQKLISIIQKSNTVYTTTDYKESGFVMASFLNQDDSVIIPFSSAIITEYDISELNNFYTDFSNNKKLKIQIEKESYIKLLDKSIQYIQDGNASKIVLSRKIKQKLNNRNVSSLYLSVLKAYPSAFVYIWHHPTIGLWLGASPEKLLELQGNTIRTMALAGTQNYNPQITWKTKEIEEQKWVSEYIKEQLKDLTLNLKVSDDYTKKAGHLAHICSDIEGELHKNIHLKEIIEALHPTPAVCGVPKEIAMEFITNNEPHNRHYYTGFLGEINMDDTTDLYVNLRCMEIKIDKTFLYVGGGITKDSIPEKEWEEILNKAMTLGAFF